MTEFKDKLNTIFSNQKNADDRYLEILRGNDDEISLVLRGHLIVEELLFSVIQAHCQEPVHLEGAQLRVPQLLALVRALQKLPSAPESLWQSIQALNSLRNKIAHKLSLKDRSEWISKFVKVALGDKQIKELKVSTESKDALLQAICYMLGQLSVVSIFHAALEELIVEMIKNPTKTSKESLNDKSV